MAERARSPVSTAARTGAVELCTPGPHASASTFRTPAPYRSFWQGGFEGADHVNGSGTALCLNSLTDHVARAGDDYAGAAALGLRTVRESAGWRGLSGPDGTDLSSVRRRAEAAREAGVQILWTCFHYGTPPEVDLFADDFPQRLAAHCAALARALRPYHDDQPEPPVYTPVNEISFLCWAASETGLIHPYRGDRAAESYALKRRLVRAAILAAAAIRSEEPTALMLGVEPLVHITSADPAHSDAAAARNGHQFQAFDMLCGRTEPELGGHDGALDLIGVNYYPYNQWEFHSGQPLTWPHDPLRRPLSLLLRELHLRYRRPLAISETSHVDGLRAAWLEDVAVEVGRARDAGVDVRGICLYPLLDRPDWERPHDWHRSGLWHVCPDSLARRLEPAYGKALARMRDYLDADVAPLARAAPASTPTSLPIPRSPMDTLIVFSHLRWNFVHQRPQHVLSRIASRWQVLYVEEPVHGASRLEVSQPAPGVTVLRPHTPVDGAGFDGDQLDAVATMVKCHLDRHGITRYGIWFYTPMALPMMHGLQPQLVVYDCMDELSAFDHAPPALLAREEMLFRAADVVFTGGPSLYDAKRERHHDVHCLPSSVDAAHFGQGRDAAIASPLLADLPRPRLGYFGVVDERLDLALLAAVADADPTWQVVVVGPVVKIDPATLPRRTNVHYLGQQDYADLPALLAGWDACLMPFALNASTRFISPTKTLEYMCAAKPVVSTAIADVRRLYGTGVTIADDHVAFVAGCRAALAEGADAVVHRRETQAQLVEATSWDRTAERMVTAIDACLEAAVGGVARGRRTGEAASGREENVGRDGDDTLPGGASAAVGQRSAADDHVVDMAASGRRAAQATLSKDGGTRASIECLIVGAGPTGLAAAYHLGNRSLLVDANQAVGGWCRSIEEGGFTFDYAGHIMFSNDPDVLALYQTLLGDNLHWQNREAWVYSKGVHTRYPFQGALHGLPVDVLKECIVGAIEARFGSIEDAPRARGDAGSPPAAAPVTDARREPPKTDCCADGAVPDAPLEGDVKDHVDGGVTGFATRRAPRNFEEFIYQVWGAGVAKHFAVPYNRKLWTVPLQEMETSWLGGRVPLPNLEEMIDGALRPVSKPVGPNARFGYPLRGGFQALMDGFLPHLHGDLRLGTRLVGVDIAARIASFDDGATVRYDTLLSTVPLPDLVRMLGDQAPEHVRRAASALRHVSVRCVNLGVARAGITDKHWIYYPEQTVFHRIFVQGNASPHNNPDGGFGLTCEITYSPTKPLPCDGQALIDRCIAECREVGMLREDDLVEVANLVDMPYAYVIYDHARAENVARIRTWLASRGIQLAGRYSEWEYYNSDHAFVAGRRAAQAIGADEAVQGRSA